MKTLSYKYYNKQTTTPDRGNVQSYDQEESKLNSTINGSSGVHTLTFAHTLILLCVGVWAPLKHWNRFVKLVVIFLILTRCDYMIPSLISKNLDNLLGGILKY